MEERVLLREDIMLPLVIMGVLVVNVPFGFWRAGTRKLSAAWFAAVHLPIPLVAAMRLVSGLGWQWKTFPFFLLAYCAGQFIGGRLRRVNARPSPGGSPRGD